MKSLLIAGRESLAIPGPSVMPDRVMREFARPMIDIYEGELVDISNQIVERLPHLAGTVGTTFIAVCNGHGAWEMALTNTLSRGDKVLVFNCGVFAAVWGQAASANGIEVTQIDAPDGRAVTPDLVAEHLAADLDHEYAAVLMVHSDTGSSARNDIAAIGEVMRASGHPALLMVDCIASFGCESVTMDAWGADVVVAASQKGMMTPPGLGFNFASQRAIEAHSRAGLRTAYWDWTARMDESAHYLRYAGTPPVSHIFALREALRMIDEEGLPARFARHGALASAVHAAVEVWRETAGFDFLIVQPSERCHSVTTISTGPVDATELRRICKQQIGLILGLGLHPLGSSTFRIGHMGHVDAPMLLGALGAVDMALAALGVVDCAPTGVGAAAQSLGVALRG